jgi:ADP-ribose pyrophosphatase
MNSTQKIVLKEGRFIRFVQMGEWEFFERHNCKGIVIIVALTRDKKVLFVEQFRPPVGKSVIEFPAGLVNDHDPSQNESLLKAAQRELFEETGYRARHMKKLLDGPVSGGATSDILTMVRAYDLKKVGPGGGDGTEGITVHEVPLKNVYRWLKSQEKKGFLIEPKVYAGLYFLAK